MGGGQTFLCCEGERALCDPRLYRDHPQVPFACGGAVANLAAGVVFLGTLLGMIAAVFACHQDIACKVGVAWGMLAAFILLESFLVFAAVMLWRIATSDDISTWTETDWWSIVRKAALIGAAVVGSVFIVPVALPFAALIVVFIVPFVAVFLCGFFMRPCCHCAHEDVEAAAPS